MQQKYYWIIGIIAILGILVISGYVKKQIIAPTEKRITNQCINELNVFENKFGISEENIKVLDSECSTCSPWYTPQVAEFKATIEKDNNNYNLLFSSSCPRHETDLRKYCISTEKKDNFYDSVKQKICSDIRYLSPDEGKILCNPEVKFGVNDIDSFVVCLEEFNLMRGIDVNEGKVSCGTKCNNDNNCLLSCFEEYVKETRSNLFDEWCDAYETTKGNKIIFSVEYPASSNEWNNTKIGEDC